MRPTTTIVQVHRWEPPAGVPPGGLPPGMPASAPAAAPGEYVDGGWIPCRQDPLPEATCGCVRNPSLQVRPPRLPSALPCILRARGGVRDMWGAAWWAWCSAPLIGKHGGI